MNSDNKALTLIVGVIFIFFVAPFAYLLNQEYRKEQYHKELVQSCVDTGMPMYKCEKEVTSKKPLRFDFNFGVGKKDSQ